MFAAVQGRNMRIRYRQGFQAACIYAFAGFIAFCVLTTSHKLGSAQAKPSPIKVKLPKDEARHNVPIEWWYYTGHLVSENGKRYGFEYVTFQVEVRRNQFAYAAQFAITDRNKRTFHYDQKMAFAPPIERRKGAKGFNLQLGDWNSHGHDGRDHIHAAISKPKYALKIALTDLKGPVAHNKGLFSYGKLGSSYYYSRPRLALTGTLRTPAGLKRVKGSAWFDHQWGKFSVSRGGWDWFSIQLNDQSELMIYNLRNDNRELIQTFATYVPKRSRKSTRRNHFAHSIAIKPELVTLKSSGSWLSPVSKANYPSGWLITVKRSKLTPAINLKITPRLKDQEVGAKTKNRMIYWEGDCAVSGTKAGRKVNGNGYVELVGYVPQR